MWQDRGPPAFPRRVGPLTRRQPTSWPGNLAPVEPIVLVEESVRTKCRCGLLHSQLTVDRQRQAECTSGSIVGSSKVGRTEMSVACEVATALTLALYPAASGA
jgi:hypothetical protein